MSGAEQKILLHVGSGPKNPEKVPVPYSGPEWREVRLDIDPDTLPDILDDIRDMLEVESGFADALLSSHNLEHLYPHEVAGTLEEFHRVLKPGGHAMIACPDLQQVAEFIVGGNLTEPVYTAPAGPVSPLDILYGFRPSLKRGNLFMAHHTGFTAQSLGEAMAEAGFVDVTVQRVGGARLELLAVGYKQAK